MRLSVVALARMYDILETSVQAVYEGQARLLLHRYM